MSFRDGWEVNAPQEGFLDPEVLSILVESLAEPGQHTEDATIAIWDGWSELTGTASRYFRFEPDGRTTDFGAEPESSVSTEIKDHMERVARQFLLPNRAVAGVFELPHRTYVLMQGSLDELTDPTWPERAGIGWSRTTGGVMPQLVWPADASWCIGTDIDFDFTIVGGTREAVDRVLGLPDVEAFEVDPGADLSWNGDTVNKDRTS